MWREQWLFSSSLRIRFEGRRDRRTNITKTTVAIFYSCFPPRVILPLRDAVKLLLVFPFRHYRNFYIPVAAHPSTFFRFSRRSLFPRHPRRHITHVMIHVFFPLLGFMVVSLPPSPRNTRVTSENAYEYISSIIHVCVYFVFFFFYIEPHHVVINDRISS